jgi:hypothetical protein
MATRENVAIAHDEVRDLIAKGWTPPAAVASRYRHILRPFYQAKGYHNAAEAKTLDSIDVETIGALIAVFEHFGIAVPEPVADQ